MNLKNGDLDISGTSFDQVDDLRQLSLDLKKSGLKPSQALLGITFLKRFLDLHITLEHLEAWSELVNRLLPPDFPVKEFFEEATRLHNLEISQGKSFETITEEYKNHCHQIEKLKEEIESLSKAKSQLTNEIGPLSQQLEALQREKVEIENYIRIRTSNIEGAKSRLKEVEEEKSTLDRETKNLQRRKVKLSSEIDGREESLRRLNDIGLSDEDLLRLRSFIKRTSKNEGISGKELKVKFFSALALFEDISGLENRLNAETQEVSELVKKQSILRGEIVELEKNKGLLEGEISVIISSTSQRVKDIGEDAASQIQQQVMEIRDQLNGLLVDALKAGEAIGGMRQILKKSQESEKSLDNFIKEVQGRKGRS